MAKPYMVAFENAEFVRQHLLDGIVQAWKPVAAGIVTSILDAIEVSDWDTAFKIAANISFDAITTKVAERVKFDCHLAYVDGTHICHDDPHTLALTQQKDRSEIVNNVVAQFVTSLNANGADYLRTAAAAAVALIEKSRMIVKSDVGGFDPVTVRKAADDALAQMLNDAVMRGGVVRVNIGANLATSRLISYGSLTELQATGATHYKWTSVLEPNTCNVCRALHGRTFEAGPALHRLDAALRSQDPNDLKSLTPFAPTDKEGLGKFFQMTTGELQSRGYGMPPIHPHCACYVVPVDHPLGQSWLDAARAAIFGRTDLGAPDAADEAA